MSLTAYQRGHRDALQAFADELERRKSDRWVDYARRRSMALQVIARLRREGLSEDDKERLMGALAYPGEDVQVIAIARFRSQALPEDPEVQPNSP